MPNIIIRPDWYLPESKVTSEHVFRNRRRFLKEMGFLGAGLLTGIGAQAAETVAASTNAVPLYPAKRNPAFSPDSKLSDEKYVGTYNNFYEFSTSKERVHRLVEKFQINPWTISVGGLVEKPMKIRFDEFVTMFPLEERVYRLRCVEAWAMVVPWTGFPLHKLLEKVEPKPNAKFVRFRTFFRPTQAPGQGDTSYPWPYTEGLRLDEAMHDLTLVTTGLYGRPLPKQNGGPVRIVVPWKYGYKSIKSIVAIDLVEKQPATLWETMAPDEYPFESNVNPAVPHPRWSQATERMIDTGNRVNTLPFNGYGAQVAKLYAKL